MRTPEEILELRNLKQRTTDWFIARAGSVTGSQVADAICFLKNGNPSAGRTALKAKIAAEIMTGEPVMGGYCSPEMNYGTESEPFALAAYEVRFDASIDEVGIIPHPSIERAMFSPDGLIGKTGLVEAKCPKTATHIDYMLAGRLPHEYEPQVMFGLACTGRDWCDFISFDDRLPSRHKLFVKRVTRDEKRIAEIEAGVIQFLAEVDEMIASLEKLNPELSQAQRIFGKDYMNDPELLITDQDLPSWWREVEK